MSKKKKKISKEVEKAEKILSYGIIIGLAIGVIIAFVLFMLTDNMLWMVIPIITLFIGMGVSAIINKNISKPKTTHNK